MVWVGRWFVVVRRGCSVSSAAAIPDRPACARLVYILNNRRVHDWNVLAVAVMICSTNFDAASDGMMCAINTAVEPDV